MKETSIQRMRIVFTGRVQGVGFRATARSVARGHAVSGWVRNEPDGTVMMEVQGEKLAVRAYLAELRGMLGKLVTNEASSAASPEPAERGFEVR